MIHYKDVHIPSPCSIRYDSLPYDPEKRPCTTCQKPVYDFRNKDEAYFNRIWKKHKGDFCGAFRHDQFSSPALTEEKIFSLRKLRSSIAALLLGLWTTFTKANDHVSAQKPGTELWPGDSTVKDQKQSFTVMTKECKNCKDVTTFNLYINKKYYKTYYMVNDSTDIVLPDSIGQQDLITLKYRRTSNRGFKKVINKVKTVSFRLGNREVVEIKATKRQRIRLIPKHERVGCPKFR
jgi:hypothetical protein